MARDDGSTMRDDEWAMDKAGSQGRVPPMTDFHAVFPYPVSPIEASGNIRVDGLGRPCDGFMTRSACSA
jgi:hypothetical protein